jgi:hypothetical protein
MELFTSSSQLKTVDTWKILPMSDHRLKKAGSAYEKNIL